MAVVIGGLTGAFLPITDLGYLDLAHGRRIDSTGELHPPPVEIVQEGTGPPTGWLGSRLLYQAHLMGEETALRLFAASLTAAGALVLYLACPGISGFLVSTFAVSIVAPLLEISTLLYSWPLLAAMAYLLTTLSERSKWRALILPVLFLIWSTLNREAAVGLFILGLVVLEQIIEPLSQTKPNAASETRVKWRSLVLLAGSVALSVVFALAVLPGGVSNLYNPVRLGLLMRQAGTAGWAPVSFPEHIPFFLYAVLAGLSVGQRPWRKDLAHTVVLAIAVILALVSRHFVITFVAMAGPLTAQYLKPPLTKLSSSKSILARSAGIPALILLTVILAGSRIDEPEGHPYEKTVHFLSQHNLSGPLFNVPEAGGLIGWLEGPIPFSDLRPQSLARYQMLSESGGLRSRLKSKETLTALLNWNLAREHVSPEDLAASGLQLVYMDDAGLLYARSKANPITVTRFAFRHFDPLKHPEDYAPETLPLATQELFELLERHDPSIRALSHLGELLTQEEREEEALEAYEAARRLSPDNLEILSELSHLYAEKAMYGLAEQSSRYALALGADHELTHILARALYGQGRFEEAAAWFERVIAKDPDNLAALRAIVDIYQRLERPDLGLEHRQRLTVVEESAKELLLAEARRKRMALDFEGAADAYQRAHESRLSDMEILWDLVVVLLADGRNERAASTLREMVEIDPEHGLAHLTLGVLCAQKLDCEPEEARRHLEAFLELAPDDINADLARRELTALARRR